MRPRQFAIHGNEQRRAFVGIVHREPLPIAAMTQIGKEALGIPVEMQKSPAFDIEDPEPLLDEITAPPEVLDQVADRLEGAHIGVFHHLLHDRQPR